MQYQRSLAQSRRIAPGGVSSRHGSTLRAQAKLLGFQGFDISLKLLQLAIFLFQFAVRKTATLLKRLTLLQKLA
jgi:hypothetical protein